MGLNEPLPDYMLPYVYEVVKGKPIFRKGYREALLNIENDTNGKFMGASSLQVFIISEILKFLYKNLPDNLLITTGEHGIHLAPRSNRCLDIALFKRKEFIINKKYTNHPPLVAIEVDIEADLTTWQETEIQYYKNKTQDLLNFGVEKVVWIFTESQSIIVAQKENPWQIYDFKDDVLIINDCHFNLGKIIET